MLYVNSNGQDQPACLCSLGSITGFASLIVYGPQREKTCLVFTNNKGVDQPVHSPRLIDAFVIRFLESIISKLASSKISNPKDIFCHVEAKIANTDFLWHGSNKFAMHVKGQVTSYCNSLKIMNKISNFF